MQDRLFDMETSMRHLTALAFLALLAACDRGSPLPGVPSDTGLVLARSSRAKDSLIIVKDSLLADRARQLSLQSQIIGDATASARLVAEIERDLSRVRSLRVQGDTNVESAIQTMESQLSTVQKKVTALINRLNASEARLRQIRSDSASHAAADAATLAQLKEHEQSIAELRATVEQQRSEIAMLEQKVDSVVRANIVLVSQRDSVVIVANTFAAREDSVFVAIGSEKELAQKGLVRREGGTLLMFGRGKTMVPGRTLDPALFTVLSKARDRQIALPRADKEYRIVSRQALEYTDLAKPKDAVVRGTLTITDADRFWAPSKFLILVEK
jgi:flagellar biosynthesis chaperone FliJ